MTTPDGRSCGGRSDRQSWDGGRGEDRILSAGWRAVASDGRGQAVGGKP